MNGSNYNPSNFPYDVNDYDSHQSNQYSHSFDQREAMHIQGESFANYETYSQSSDSFIGQYNISADQYNMVGDPPFQYQENDIGDFSHGSYQDYHLNEIDSFQQNISPGEFASQNISPGEFTSQNISPASFSSDSRQFYQDQLTETPPQGINVQPDVPIGHQAHHQLLGSCNDHASPASNIEPPFTNQSSPKRLGNIQKPEVSSSVNGILEMEGSVEPNGPILGGHGYIPAQTVQKAYYELGETPEIKAACLRGFRQQIDIHQEENNFDEHSDAFLLKFLRSRKFDVEAAYALLEKYYNVRENKPEVFRNLTRKNVKRTMEQGIVGVLPQRDKKGRVIMTFNFSKWNMSLPFHFEKLLRVFVYTLEKLFENEETQINGVVIICNLAQLGVLQTKSLGVPMIDKVLEIFEGNFPFRLNAIHLLNPPWHFKLLWKMVDPLKKIKQKMARRIFIHDGDLSRFQAEFDAEILPKELGGKCPPYDNTLWVKEILEPEQSQQSQNKKLQALQPPSTPNLRRSPTQGRKSMKN